MGIFDHKQKDVKSPADEAKEAIPELFDDEFRAELKSYGRTYFEKAINDNLVVFKQQLDSTMVDVKNELKNHIAKQLDEKLTEYTEAMKDAQSWTIRSLNHSAQDFQQEHQELSSTLKKNVADQQDLLVNSMKDAQDLALQSLTKSEHAFQAQYELLGDELKKTLSKQEKALEGVVDTAKTQSDEIQDVQAKALKMLHQSVKDIHDKHAELQDTLEESIAEQKKLFISVFEENMARVVEHYLLGALGDQFDLKAQLPGIIKQMEANKQAMVDDLRL